MNIDSVCFLTSWVLLYLGPLQSAKAKAKLGVLTLSLGGKPLLWPALFHVSAATRFDASP